MLTNIWPAKLAVDTKATSFRLAPGRAGTFDQTGFNNDTCLEHAPSDPTNTNTFDNTSHRSLSIQLKRFLTETSVLSGKHVAFQRLGFIGRRRWLS